MKTMKNLFRLTASRSRRYSVLCFYTHIAPLLNGNTNSKKRLHIYTLLRLHITAYAGQSTLPMALNNSTGFTQHYSNIGGSFYQFVLLPCIIMDLKKRTDKTKPTLFSSVQDMT